MPNSFSLDHARSVSTIQMTPILSRVVPIKVKVEEVARNIDSVLRGFSRDSKHRNRVLPQYPQSQA